MLPSPPHFGPLPYSSNKASNTTSRMLSSFNALVFAMSCEGKNPLSSSSTSPSSLNFVVPHLSFRLTSMLTTSL